MTKPNFNIVFRSLIATIIIIYSAIGITVGKDAYERHKTHYCIMHWVYVDSGPSEADYIITRISQPLSVPCNLQQTDIYKYIKER